jgi:phosphoribosylanthranilate isomerase
MTLVKICGINDASGFDAVAEASADMVGLVFYPPSPRAVTAAEAAVLSARVEGGPMRVGLFVDPTDAELETVLAALPLGMIQLHGQESPARCAAIRARFGLPVMKAVGVGDPRDLEGLAFYTPTVDRFLLDAKPPPDSDLPGGNALAFDWSLTAGRTIPRPWLLAGGLTPETVVEAIRQSGATGVDVSSGVERARGVKDPARIAAFVAAVRGAEA